MFIALTRWQLWKQCFWKRMMTQISFWTWCRSGRVEAACKPPSPTAPGFQLAHLHGSKEAGNSLAVRSRSCWHRVPCESPAWYRKAPWSWSFSYSKWIWGSGVYRLYFPLFDPQVHGDCQEAREKKKEKRRLLALLDVSQFDFSKSCLVDFCLTISAFIDRTAIFYAAGSWSVQRFYQRRILAPVTFKSQHKLLTWWNGVKRWVSEMIKLDSILIILCGFQTNMVSFV